MKIKFEIAKESKQPQGKTSGQNFEKIDLGSFQDLNDYICENIELGIKNQGKIFLNDLLKLSGTEISLNYIPAGYKAPFKHIHHENEEVYIFLKGKGFMEVDDEKIVIEEGSVVKVKPEGIRTLENSESSEMIFIVIQSKTDSLNEYTLSDAKIV